MSKYKPNLPNRESALDTLGRTPARDVPLLIESLVNVVWDEYEAGNLTQESAIGVGHALAHSMFWGDPVFRRRREAVLGAVKARETGETE